MVHRWRKQQGHFQTSCLIAMCDNGFKREDAKSNSSSPTPRDAVSRFAKPREESREESSWQAELLFLNFLFHEKSPEEIFIGCLARGPRQSANNRDRTFCPRSQGAFREKSHTRTFWRWLKAMSDCIVEAVLGEEEKKGQRRETKKRGNSSSLVELTKSSPLFKILVIGQGFSAVNYCSR